MSRLICLIGNIENAYSFLGGSYITQRIILLINSVQTCLLLHPSAAYICVHLRLDFIKVGNTMNPDQTAPTGAV